MGKIVVITVPGSQRVDFVNELQKRTGEVVLVVVQKKKKKSFSKRIRGFYKKVGIFGLPEELIYFFLQKLPKYKVALRSTKIYTPFNKNKLKYPKETIFVDNVNSKEVIDRVSKIKPDVISIWGGLIVSNKILGHSIYAVNIHAGVCPYYRGSNGNQHAIVNDERGKLGITIHYAVEKVDAGKILASIQPDPNQPKMVFFRQLNDQGTKKYLEIIEGLINGKNMEGESQDISKGHNYLLKEWTYKKQYILAKKLRAWD